MSNTPFATALSGTVFGVSFDPVVDQLQVISNTGQNLLVNETTGTDTASPPLKYDPTYEMQATPGSTPNVVAIANTNKVSGATTSSLYGIDSTQQSLVTIGQPGDGSDPTHPNNGNTLTVNGSALMATTATMVGFTVQQSSDPFAPAYATYSSGGTTQLYQINLTTGAEMTSLGNVGSGLALDRSPPRPSPPGRAP